MLVANARDLRFTPIGMSRQKRIASPKIRNFTSRARRCAANESPYGPAPTIAMSMPCLILINYPAAWPTFDIDVEDAHDPAPKLGCGHEISPSHWRRQFPSHIAL